MINKDGKKVTTKPWQTKRWRETRARLIKDECSQCGSEKKPMVLQHLWHSPPFRFVLRQVQNEFVDEKRKFKKYQPKIPKNIREGAERECCPKCNSTNINYCPKKGDRKGPKRYVCRKCELEEFNPGVKILLKDDGIRKIMRENWKMITEKFNDEILRQTNEINKEYHEKYMSGEGTTTFCKKCAFLWDKQGKKLCTKCKKNYHPMRYNGCVECNNKKCPSCGRLSIPKNSWFETCRSCQIGELDRLISEDEDYFG